MAHQRQTVLEIQENDPLDPNAQSEEKMEFKDKLLSLFDKSKTQRQRQYSYFNDMQLLEYVENNHDFIIGRVLRIDNEGWRSNTSTQMIRNKFVSALATLLLRFIQPEVFANDPEKEDAKEVARVLEEFLLEEQKKNKWFQDYLNMLIETMSQGTVFIETGFARRMREIKEVTEVNIDEGKTKWEKREIVDFEGLFNNIVPIEEVYLGNMFTQRMEDQPFIFRRQRMDYMEAQKLYGRYEDFDKVLPFKPASRGSDGEPDYKRTFTDADMIAGQVEIITYQSRQDDEMGIVANNILLTDVDTPLPYAHKEYSIVKGMFNPFDSTFAYGKSFAAEEMFNQVIADTLINMLVDKTYLSIFPPLFVKGRDHITSDVIVPGAITPVDQDGDVFTAGTVGSPVSGAEVNMFNLIQSIQSNAGIPTPGRAASPQGGAVAARQVLAQQQEAVQLGGLFEVMIAFLIEDLSKLQLQNILDFVIPNDVDEETQEVLENSFLLENRRLSNGKRGTLLVRTRPIEQQPSTERELQELIKEENRISERRNEEVRIIYLDPELIRGYDLLVTVQANPKSRKSSEVRKALEIEFFNVFAQNPLANLEQLSRDLAEAFEKDPDKVLKIQEEQPVPGAQQGQGATAPGAAPGGDVPQGLEQAIAQATAAAGGGAPQGNQQTSSQLLEGGRPGLQELIAAG